MLFSQPKKWLTSLFYLIIIIVGLALIPWRFVNRFIESPFSRLSLMVYNFTNSIKAVGSINFLMDENEKLRQALAGVTGKNIALELCEQDKNELKKLLSVNLPSGYTWQVVEVIGRQLDDTGQSYLINAGRQQGLRVGTPLVIGINNCILGGATLVGVVFRVNEQTAGFRLTTAHGNQVLAQVMNISKSSGVAVGEFNLGIRLQFVPPNEELKIDDAVVTSHLDPLVPAGLFIGRLSTINKVPGDFWQSATVVPPIFLDRFRYLYSLIPR